MPADTAALATALLHDNLMLRDALGSLLGAAAFSALLFAPGYVLAWGVDLVGFRRMRFARQSLWAIAVSFLISPIAGYFLGRMLGLRAICVAGCSCVAVLLVLLWRQRSAMSWSAGERRPAAFLGLGWCVFVLLMLIDFQHGARMYFSTTMADMSYRIAFTDAVARTGVPPANPLYLPGTPAPMHYYYFWYVLGAAVMKLVHITAGQAYIASCMWAGFGLMAVTALATRHFFRWERRTRWIALALLAVMGADLVPAVSQALLQPSVNGDIEWWSVDPIDAWPDSLLWVPHHVAAVLCCLTVFLLLWHLRAMASRRERFTCVGLAAVGFASAVGLSVYVSAGFALMMLAWLVWLTGQRDAHRRTLWFAASGAAVASFVLLIPFLRELLAGAGSAGTAGGKPPGTPIFLLSVRRMIDSELLTGLPIFHRLERIHPVLLDQTVRLVLLLPGLAMELGAFGVLLFLVMRARRRGEIPADPARDTAIFLAVCGLVLTMFLSSSVISNNDFGYRAVMLPQFFLWLLSAEVLASWRSEQRLFPVGQGVRRLVWTLLVLGMAGTAYGAVLLRGWLPLETHRPADGYGDTPADAFSLRQVFADLDRIAPSDAVIAFGPINPDADRRGIEVMTPSEFYQRMLVMDARRQILNAEMKCASHFGGDPDRCPAIQQLSNRLYAAPAEDEVSVIQSCGVLGVDYLLLSHRDVLSSAVSGWPTGLPLVASRPGFRVFACSARAREAAAQIGTASK
jgi:hypothetical protein